MHFTVQQPACDGPLNSERYSTLTRRFDASWLNRGRNAASGCAGTNGFGRAAGQGGRCGLKNFNRGNTASLLIHLTGARSGSAFMAVSGWIRVSWASKQSTPAETTSNPEVWKTLPTYAKNMLHISYEKLFQYMGTPMFLRLTSSVSNVLTVSSAHIRL